MSILIRGMEMPKDCMHCFMPCELPLESALVGKRMDDCPLIEVHAPHGDLVDIDKALNHLPANYNKEDLEDAVATAPTVIEAEEEENEKIN